MIDEVDRLKNARLLAIAAKGEYAFEEISGHFSCPSAVWSASLISSTFLLQSEIERKNWLLF